MTSVDDDFFGEQNASSDAALREREWKALRREHVKAGYREGSERGHDAEMQAGFDSGFLAGAKATADAGFWLGASAVVEAFYRPARGKRGPPPGDSEVVQRDVAAVKEARSELEREVSKVAESEVAVDASKTREACERIIVMDREEGIPVSQGPETQSRAN